MIFARRCFLFAAITGLMVLLPQYFLEQQIGRNYPPPISHPHLFYGFVGVAIVWQIAFLIIASDPLRFRPMMIAAILEKLSFAVPTTVLFMTGRSPSVVFGAAMFDLFLGVLFVLSYLRTAPDWATPRTASTTRSGSSM
jgi:hypothetical protein